MVRPCAHRGLGAWKHIVAGLIEMMSNEPGGITELIAPTENTSALVHRSRYSTLDGDAGASNAICNGGVSMEETASIICSNES